MKKISFKNIFKKSETGGNKTGKVLFILLIILIVAGVFYWWGYPLLFPVTSVKSPVTTTATVTAVNPTAVATKTDTEAVVKEKTEFEIEMEKRKSGYEEKIFVYEPYEPPSNRNPFQKVSTSYFLEETAEEEEGKEGSALKFLKPELPPGTKLTGVIGSKDNMVAIIVMNQETFIANLYDILLDRYIVKEIKKDEVIIDYNGYFFSLKIG
ncbi:MAG: hypothetical protein U9O91_03535, partial [Candidatus Caldatribacteriota bacterium]|nr:hypothetical protein [Candidatus Caldatribacteriota bacterium]